MIVLRHSSGFLLLLCAVYNDTVSSAGIGINMTEPCQYAVPVGLEKGYIPDSNIWVTSSINSIRGARYGRLRGWQGLCVVYNYVGGVLSLLQLCTESDSYRETFCR